ncbi:MULTISPECIES: transposase [Rhodococcus]|nr:MULTISPECIES: transposase [Rhodococcus]UPK66191.1 transposase [Rhodococcus pyridinivorans]
MWGALGTEQLTGLRIGRTQVGSDPITCAGHISGAKSPHRTLTGPPPPPPTEARRVAACDVAAGVRPGHSVGVRPAARIRNRHDLNFYRPEASARYQHIDSLFGDNVLDWALLETHRPDLMCTVPSTRDGRLSSVTRLRKLGNHSRNKARISAHRGQSSG